MNPLLASWSTPFGMPPFDLIKPVHFEEAFAKAIEEHDLQVQGIAEQADEPSFKNTLVAFENAGQLLKRISLTFNNLNASCSSEDFRAIEKTWAPVLASHHAHIFLNAPLFARIDSLNSKISTLGLDVEDQKLLRRHHTDFVRAGARLSTSDRKTFANNSTRLAQLFTQFSQNVLRDESQFQMELAEESELAGLPDFVLSAARSAAIERGLKDPRVHVITLARASVTPFMIFSTRRDLRQKLWHAWCHRGEQPGEHDNRPLIKEILKLRLQQAQLLGFKHFADFALSDTMAATPEAVRQLLMRAWQPAKEKAKQERLALAQAATESTGQLHKAEDIQAWDWHHWSEKVRKATHDLDEAEIKPYLQLDSLIQAMFDVAGRLFGVRFQPRSDLAAYHARVTCWEVTDDQGHEIGLFLSDNFARSNKRSGAWMSNYREQTGSPLPTRPIVVNNNNFSSAPPGQPTLLSLDDAKTLFHEFGHGLHSLLSQCKYARLAGLHVLKDFVEFPSQIFENWLLQPEIMNRYARHFVSNQAMPATLMKKILSTQTFNQGFSTVEYVACALLDLSLHEQTNFEMLDLDQFEREGLSMIGMPGGIGMRHRIPHFSHLFSSNYYASAYYVYLWADVLVADGFDAFLEKGDPFDSQLSAALKKHVYEAGASVDPMEAFIAFRGREPTIEPMLRKRGL